MAPSTQGGDGLGAGEDIFAGSGGTLFSTSHAMQFDVLGFNQSSPPSSPNAGDAYVVARGATGVFYLWDDDIAICEDATGDGRWRRKRAVAGMRVFHPTSGQARVYDGASWKQTSTLGFYRPSIVAGTSQNQGEIRLGHTMNYVSTVGVDDDAVTLPPAVSGLTCVVANAGAHALAVFPFEGEIINALSADASISVPAGKRMVFWAGDGRWSSVLGA